MNRYYFPQIEQIKNRFIFRTKSKDSNYQQPTTNLKRYIYILLAALCLAGCELNEPIPTITYRVKMNLSIPIDDQSAGARRAPSIGDPGTYESFKYPRHLYFYYVSEQKANPSVKSVKAIWFELDAAYWNNGNYSGNLQYDGDSIFTYTGELDMELPLELDNYNVRIYAAMSYNPLVDLSMHMSSSMTEDDIINQKFKIDNDSLLGSLENIYSTPYNYTINDKYYATLPHVPRSGTLTFNLLLYHVASKVDLIWNVPDDQQTTFNVKSIVAKQLYRKESYIFKPNMNQGKPDIGDANESYRLEVKNSADVGMQYKGRYYFYTIPYYYTDTGYDYFDIVLETQFANGESTNQYDLTLKKHVDKNQPFVPWIRGNMQFNNMPSCSQVKEVD